MGIFLRQSHNVKPSRWGSFADVQYAIRVNSEKIYGCDPEDDVLVMPLFWGLPPLDYSKYGNDGTNHGSTYKDGSLNFDGADDYVDLGTSVNMASWSALSAGAWVSYDSSGTNEHIIIGNYGGSSATVLLRLEPSDDTVEAFLIVEPNTLIGGSFLDLVLTPSQLHKVEITYDTTNGLQAYLDGVKSATSYASAAGLDATASVALRIGHSAAYGVNDFFNGTIDEARIAKTARTADQIALFHDNKYGLYQKVSKPIWSIPSGITLTIAAIDGAGLLDNVVLTQKHNLAIQGMSGAGSIDSTILTQKHLLTLQELLSSGVLDNVALIQKHLLSVQELSGAGALDNVSLTQKHLLAVQELLSSGTFDNIELILSTLLVVADLVGNGALDNIDLTQKHTLAVQSLLSAGMLDAIELILATLLVVSDLLSAGALDNTELTQKHILTVQEVLSAGVLDGIALTQKQLLIINNLLSNGLIDTINFDIVSGLIYISLSQATEYNISLSQATEYNISLSQATEYNISLSETGGGV